MPHPTLHDGACATRSKEAVAHLRRLRRTLTTSLAQVEAVLALLPDEAHDPESDPLPPHARERSTEVALAEAAHRLVLDAQTSRDCALRARDEMAEELAVEKEKVAALREGRAP